MNIVVCVKQVPDTETRVKPNGDGSFIDTSSIKWVMNPYDEFALEQALLVKEAEGGSTVTAIRVGAVKDTEALRTALAMGADKAVLVEAGDDLDPHSTAKALAGAIAKEDAPPDLVLAGKQAIDDDAMQVPQLLACMLDIPSVTVVVEYARGGGGPVVLKREVEGGGLEVYEVSPPVLVACNKGINTPRYASLPGIMRAKKKPLATHSLADVGVSDEDRRLVLSEFRLPPEKPAGKTFDAPDTEAGKKVAKEVVSLLKNEAKVL